MSQIQQLSPLVVAQIAAGEVIERPGSVVKELLENAIDAGARRIEVEVEQGGVELIRVVDDGSGIEPGELELALTNHATSKLRTAEDLFRVGTLGFRGEALASIGGVARVCLQSRPPGRPCGAEVTCHGGNLAVVRAWNGSPGTRIEVRHLFFNTPVRRKFLRTTATEMGHVSETFTRLALAHPALYLKLTHNGKLVYEVPGTAGLLDRIGLFFGAEVRDQLYAVQAEQGPVTLAGYVADPACERGHARMQYLFVNGRWVRDRSLGHAISEAYRGLLMTGRYAVAFLFLSLPPDLVDVNVHPTKAEVRFRDGQGVYHLVRASVRSRLSQANLVPLLQVPANAAATLNPGSSAAPEGRPLLARGETPGGEIQGLAPLANSGRPSGAAEQAPLSSPPPPPTRLLPSSDPLPKAIQVHDAYLVLETPDGMLVIDQHALHERILFEQLRRRVRLGQLERQRLLIPEPVELPGDQAARVLEHRAALAELGLEVEEFGGGTVLLGSYPALLGKGSPAAIFRGVIDYLLQKERPPSREQLLNDLLSTMACKAAVKAGDRLNEEQIAALLAQRDLADDAHHCPHGRPTTLLFSRKELDKQFGRI